MTWARASRSPRFARERIPWYLVAVTAAVLVALIVASASEYTSVTQAHANVSFTTAYAVTYVGTDARGVLSENGSVNLAVNLTVDNPSARVLDFGSIGLKAWIGNATTPFGFYPVFLTSFDASSFSVVPAPIPARSHGVLSLNFTLDRAADASLFEAFRSFQSGAANLTGTASDIPWTVFVLLTLGIEGIPPPLLGAASYQLNLNRIILTWGEDLGA